MKAGWRVGSLFGIPFFLDPSWFFILMLVTVLYRAEWQGYNVGGGTAWLIGLCMALLLFASVLMHELGHSLVALSQGITVNSITLFLFGGVASIERESRTPSQAFQVAIAGPAVSFGLCLLLTLANALLPLNEGSTLLVGRLASINLILAIFNMMPGLPLDGGQVLKALIWRATGDRIQGVRWAARSGQILGWFAIVLGLYLYLVTFEPALIWLAIIGWFGIRNARSYGRIADIQSILLTLTVGDAMKREFRIVDAKQSIQDFVNQYVLDTEQRVPYFSTSEGRYRGKVNVETIQQLERSEWNDVTVGRISTPLTDIPHLQETESLVQAVQRLDREDLQAITVLSPAGSVAGLLNRSHITAAILDALKLHYSPDMKKYIDDTQQYPPGLPLSQLTKTMTDEFNTDTE